jgi:outer membrane immunogenic protein
MTRRVSLLASIAAIVGCVAVPGVRPVAAQTASALVQPTVKEPAPWSGCYAGAGVGTVPGRMAVEWVPSADFTDPAQRARLRENGSGRLDGPGFVVGGLFGCNRQTRRWVWGVEADVQRTNLDEARDFFVTLPGTDGGETYLREFGSDWTATVRARSGWLLRPTVLLYATGGLAIVDADTGDAVVLQDGSANAVTDARRRPGWTAGGGVEWMLTSPWSMRVGYVYADLGSFVTTSRNSAPSPTPATIDHAHDLAEHMVVVWLTAHF